MWKRYEIWTERTDDIGKARAIMATKFEGYSEIEARGAWQGEPELSVCFVVLSDKPVTLAKAAIAAKRIRIALGQQAVMLTVQDVARVEFI